MTNTQTCFDAIENALAAAYQLINERRIGEHYLKDNVRDDAHGPKTKATCAPRSDLILDEFTSATPPSVLAVVYQLINERRVGIQDAIENALTAIDTLTSELTMEDEPNDESLRYWQRYIVFFCQRYAAEWHARARDYAADGRPDTAAFCQRASAENAELAMMNLTLMMGTEPWW